MAHPHAVGQRRAGRGVELIGLGVILGKDQTADRQHRGRCVPHQLRRVCGRQRQCTALQQLPQGQRCGGLPACQRKGLLCAQPVGAEKPQKASQLLAGVLPCTAAGQRTADHGTAAAQLQHRCAGQQIEGPPAGRVLPEQPQMRAKDSLKVRLAGQAAQVFGFMFRSGDGLNHGGTSLISLCEGAKSGCRHHFRLLTIFL